MNNKPKSENKPAISPSYKYEALTQLIANLKTAGIEVTRDEVEPILKESDWHMPTAFDRVMSYNQGKKDATVKRMVAKGNETGVTEYDFTPLEVDDYTNTIQSFETGTGRF
jgi:hypothetical protein